MLSQDDFKQLVKNAPLFAIDLVVLNEQNQILVGKRNNAPAQGYWFVPGGRVFKNEPLAQAFTRITQSELGQAFEYHQAWLLGLHDHFYDDSVFSKDIGNDISTHYINAPHLIRLKSVPLLDLPNGQHQDYRWVSLEDIEQDSSVHPYSKVFMATLKELQRTENHD